MVGVAGENWGPGGGRREEGEGGGGGRGGGGKCVYIIQVHVYTREGVKAQGSVNLTL